MTNSSRADPVDAAAEGEAVDAMLAGQGEEIMSSIGADPTDAAAEGEMMDAAIAGQEKR